MSRGKYLSLEEARNSKKIKQFAKEHPSEGDKDKFKALADLMCGKFQKKQEDDQT